jgi:hypothetical protein
MSQSEWKRCPWTGLPLGRLGAVSEDQLTPEGYLDVHRLFPGCDVFSVSSFASACGFRDLPYFRDRVLRHPDCPIHFQSCRLFDESTGRPIAQVYATAQSSAAAGGAMWHAMQRTAARVRGRASSTAVSSLQVT